MDDPEVLGQSKYGFGVVFLGQNRLWTNFGDFLS